MTRSYSILFAAALLVATFPPTRALAQPSDCSSWSEWRLSWSPTAQQDTLYARSGMSVSFYLTLVTNGHTDKTLTEFASFTNLILSSITPLDSIHVLLPDPPFISNPTLPIAPGTFVDAIYFDFADRCYAVQPTMPLLRFTFTVPIVSSQVHAPFGFDPTRTATGLADGPCQPPLDSFFFPSCVNTLVLAAEPVPTSALAFGALKACYRQED